MGMSDAFGKGGGGGRLNNVAGVVLDYQFSTDFPYEAKNPKAGRKASKFNTLWLNLDILQDDTTESKIEPLFAGNADQWIISDDGHTISPNPDSEKTPQMFGNGPRFLQSAFNHGFEEPEYSVGDDINLETLINQRFQFVQEIDVEGTKARGEQVGKDGKKYPRKTLEVSEVLGEAEAPKSSKSNGKAAVKTNGKSKVVEEEDYSDNALTTLKGVLSANDGQINRSKIGTPALKVMMKLKYSEDTRNGVLPLLKSEEFLNTVDGVSYNKKTGQISTD